MAHTSPLRQLSDLIAASVDVIEGKFTKSKLEYPSLDAPFNPMLPAEGLSMSPEVIQAASLIVSACGQLTATVKIPALSLYDAVGGFHVASAMRVACEGNIVEIIREAGPNGIHAKDISKRNGLDPVKISRVLRLLATHHIFREISPDVFTNNRLSSMMDTMKPVDVLKANPEQKHVGTMGLGSLIEHTSDELLKASAYMTETLFDPITGHSDDPVHSPVAVTFKTNKPMFEWYDEPQNKFRLLRFSAAMEGASAVDPPNAICQGFDWSSLAPQSVVVDLGGGVGATTIKIAKQHPRLEYVVQDRPAVIEEAKEYWKRELPQALDNGTVKLQGHDFFTPQPLKNVSVFLLRMILHDYGQVNAVKILKQLRDVATPSTKLLIIVPYACVDDPALGVGKDIKGAEQMPSPPPLLPNLGKANAISYLGDFQMYIGLNGEERTLGSFLAITRASGWEIKEIFTVPGSMHKQLLAVPARM